VQCPRHAPHQRPCVLATPACTTDIVEMGGGDSFVTAQLHATPATPVECVSTIIAEHKALALYEHSFLSHDMYLHYNVLSLNVDRISLDVSLDLN